MAHGASTSEWRAICTGATSARRSPLYTILNIACSRTTATCERSVEKYDWSLGSWMALPPMQVPRKQFGGATLGTDLELVLGGVGEDGSTRADGAIFDSSRGLWATTPVLPSMLSARNSFGVAILASANTPSTKT